MALTHSTAARNALANAVVDLLDAGSGDASGDLIITTSDPTTLVTLPLSNPAFGAASSGIATAAAISNQNAGATGTAALFSLRDRDNTVVVSGTVTATGMGGDIELDNTSIASGQTISVTSMTYTAPD